MDESSGAQDADSSSAHDDKTLNVVVVAPRGNVILDVHFKTSKETISAVKRATLPRFGQPAAPLSKRENRVAYRVDLDVLKRQSKYFNNLLADSRFRETREIETALAKLKLKDARPEDLTPRDLPWIRIDDDDEIDRSVGREAVFNELLLILHGKDTLKSPGKQPTLKEGCSLAIFADRFDCIGPAARYLKNLRFKFPLAQSRPSRGGEDDGLPVFVNEEAVRQKILVCWLLDQPPRFSTGTRELILYGSRRWSPYADADADGDEAVYSSLWWNLPDGLEGKIAYPVSSPRTSADAAGPRRAAAPA